MLIRTFSLVSGILRQGHVDLRLELISQITVLHLQRTLEKQVEASYLEKVTTDQCILKPGLKSLESKPAKIKIFELR